MSKAKKEITIMSAYVHPPQEPIAIIGSGCRFPGGATSPSKLWKLLSQPKDVSKRVPERSFNPDGFYHQNGEHHGASNATKSYFIEEDPRLFDSVFFNISPREAEAIDPQQRLLLETVYEAMESSGLTLSQLQGSLTSAYVGIMTNDYTDTHARDPEFFSQYQATGTSRALSSNRLSYFFDWKGPSMTVDTACSSSLAAIHLALQSLRSGESEIACAAGANLLLGPDLFIGATSLHMISPSGRSQMWDAGADGYARGEGIAAVFLKTLSHALRDGDRIDALIRETGVNSDGRTKGITLPSPEAQATLIRSTYQRAGLDLLRKEHRPQYFEAHGTGTQAGDPREASAIKAAFFPEYQPGEKLLVGSIKTVIGHTEGCAGIAGVLKAMLAMKNRIVPPNQHLKNLNPKVEDSYANLQIPQQAMPWPAVPSGHPLRASVNSFGFGGTNSHAILESYMPELHDSGPWAQDKAQLQPRKTVELSRDEFSPVPFVLSANSDKALVQVVADYAELLRSNGPGSQDLLRLAWTLQRQRSVLPQYISFSGTTSKEILADMEKKLAQVVETPGKSFGQRASATKFSSENPPRILGVFTGQGAQWPQMGRHLILRSASFRDEIKRLEESLHLLPDAPSWSLEAELMAPPTTSRLSEAALSQPLCTAVQVALCNLLELAGIRFHTVVGHSSGEIAAAYAAGRISATDAIRIAYYRGVHAKHASGAAGQKGSMIAVGFGIDEAKIFCSSALMNGRLTVAASNSPGGVTLSGDEDAVTEAKELLDERGLFNRVLQVDTAYHSHHMGPCAEIYVQSLVACGIEVLPATNDKKCTWVSSVYGSSRVPGNEELRATYWRDNMVQTVLFSQAVDEALDLLEPFDFAIEVGPHPALRGPALQTIKAKLGREVPYAGVLDRKKNDVQAFSDFLGSARMTLSPDVIDLAGYASAFFPDFTAPQPLADLPTYPWQHETVLWRESRLNKQFRLRSAPPHELLGVRTMDDTPHEMRWRNLLKLDELSWLSEHRIQGQIIVPGAVYCIMALEAAKVLAASHGKKEDSVVVEVRDLHIEKPIALDDSSEATETLFSLWGTEKLSPVLSKTSGVASEQSLTAEFVLSAGAVEDGVMRRVCRGNIVILTIPEPTAAVASQQYSPRQDLRPMSIERFYRSLGKVGLDYSGPFQGLTFAERALDTVSGVIARHDIAAGLAVHPSWLDVSFQSLFAALSAPGDEFMWTTFVPSHIRKIRFGPHAGVIKDGASPSYYVDAFLTGSQQPFGASLATITGDISVFNGTSSAMEIQIEDLTMTALLPSNAKEDRQMYMRTLWLRDIDDGFDISSQTVNRDTKSAESLLNARLMTDCDLVVRDYLLRLEASNDSASGQKFKRAMSEVLSGISSTLQAQPNIASTEQDAILSKATFTNSTAMQLVVAIGDALLRKLQGHINGRRRIETIHTLWIDYLHSLSRNTEQVQQSAQLLRQISHKHPNMRVLQIGTKTNTDAHTMIKSLQRGFSSYTVITRTTDSVTDDVIETLKALAVKDSRIEILDLNSEISISESLAERSFDVVLHGHESFRPASAVSLDECRQLLVSGGYLITTALDQDSLFHKFVAHGMELVHDDNQVPSGAEAGTNRLLASLQSQIQLDEALRLSGFSGIEAVSAGYNTVDNTGSNGISHVTKSNIVVSQAIDSLFETLRSPADAIGAAQFIPLGMRVAVIGGMTLETAKLASKIRASLKSLDIVVVIAHSFAALDTNSFKEDGSLDAVISLADLDSPTLSNISEGQLRKLQTTVANVKTILWTTRGAFNGTSPEQSATVGLWRSITSENAQLAFQLVDFDNKSSINEKFIVESFLRLLIAGFAMKLQDKSRFWCRETEVAVLENKVMIPRIVADVERNGRHNSRRRIIESVDHMQASIMPRVKCPSSRAEMIGLTWSSKDPVVTMGKNHTRLQLALGRGSSSVATTMIAAEDLKRPHEKDLTARTAFQEVQCALSADITQELNIFTGSMITKFRAMAIVSHLPNRKTSVILGVTQDLAHAVCHTLAEKHDTRKTVVFLTTDTALNIPNLDHRNQDAPRVIVVHPQSSTRLVRTQLPWQTECIFDLTSVTTTQSDVSLSEGIKWWCHRIKVSRGDIEAYLCLEAEADDLGSLLAQAVRYASAYNGLTSESSASYTQPGSTLARGLLNQYNAVVNWKVFQEPDNTPTVTPAEPLSAEDLFSASKTYILFGLTGQIGRSITEYMVRNGARHIILASRRPPGADTSWQASLLHTFNAHARFEAVDITSRPTVEALRARILSSSCGEMPPAIGGIANGAMILADGLFSSMTLDKMERVLRPKMLGSRNLDAVFSKDDLDFFLMFSSLSAVIGMPAQSNYAAANMYMVGLAAQRRRRNLSASVVDLGMIVGLGYISRAEGDEGSGAVETSLRRQKYMPVGERDLHEILTEAISSGKSQSFADQRLQDSGEIITGLAPYRNGESDEAPPVWAHEARFSYLVIHATDSVGPTADGSKRTLKGEIAVASDGEQIVEILQRYFMAYLAATLKLSESQMGVNVPIIDFGIDSLVAVEIRSWFSLETGQDVPVLKILGGATVQQLCTTAAASMPIATAAEAEQPITDKPRTTKLAEPRKFRQDAAPRVVFTEHIDAQSLSVLPASTPGDRSAMSYIGSAATSTRSGTDTPLSSAQSDADVQDVKLRRRTETEEHIVFRSGPLSLGQARFYLPSLYLEDKSPFNCTTSYQINGPVDIDRLVAALRQVVQRHEILRTSFTTDKTTGKGIQLVLQTSGTFEPRVLKLLPTAEKAQIEAEFAKMHRHVFDLETGDTLRATILTNSSGNKDVLIFGYHHIVMDGVSWQSFLADVADCYKNTGTPTLLAAIPPGTQYLDFAAKQTTSLTPVLSQAYQERLNYWKSEFPSGIPQPMPLLPFATTRIRKQVTEYKTRTVVTYVDAEIVGRIRKVAQTLRVTSFHFWLGTFQAMLARLLQQGDDAGHDEGDHAGQWDLCIGIVDANRSDQTFAKTIGYLLEILPVRFSVDMAQKFTNLLQSVRTKAYGALAQSGVPFEEIVRACSSGSSNNSSGAAEPRSTPFFQVVFNYRMGATKAPSLVNDSRSAAQMELLNYEDATTPFDMSVSLDEKDDGSAMVTFAMLDYLYDSTAADTLVTTYKHMLDQLSRQPSLPVGEVSLFSPAKVQEAVAAGMGSSLPPMTETTVSRRIARWIERDPHAAAVKSSSGVTRTYLEISRRADVIAAALDRSAGSGGIRPGSLVCVLTEPCADTISSILAIMRLGAAYVPLDVRNADERLADVLEESGALLFLFHTATKDRAKKLLWAKQEVRCLNMSILENDNTSDGTGMQVLSKDRSKPEQTAFVMYTSGSTGKPKGIALTNRNMALQNASITSRLSIGREIVLQQSGLGFDASLCQIFMCLCNGGTLVMGDNRNMDPAELTALMERESVTVTLCMISEMAAMLRHGQESLKRCTSWRLAMCGGEAFTLQLAADFAALDLPELHVVNAYGPTEGTIIATIEDVAYREVAADGQAGRVPIGPAIPEYGVYIVDHEGNPLPRGFAGEIALAGPGVAVGYLHNPQLTSDKFNPDKISNLVAPGTTKSSASRSGWERVYRTGDKGRLVEDGKFLHLGRMEGNSQVKLRGIRIELEDIKHSILTTSDGALADAAVVIRGTTQNNQYLAAFVIFASDEAHRGDKQGYLRELLRRLPLPAYMRPAVAVPIDGSLPVTGRGKLDARLLAEMPLDGDTPDPSEDEQFLSEMEQRLKVVWQQVLSEAGVAKELTMAIKKDSDFFSVGGNSLLLMQLRVQIRKSFDGVDIPLVQLFQSSRLDSLAVRIRGTTEVEAGGELGTSSTSSIDWEAETRLDKDIATMLRTVRSEEAHNQGDLMTSTDPRCVGILLTGATGFLGGALLEKLAADPRVAVIHCAAVRGDATRVALTSPKVISHKGDLSQPLLGMTPNEAAAVMADTDVVIHNGATVSHLKSYHSLKAANVGSTKELIRLVAEAYLSTETPTTRRKTVPIHFISTGGIARLSGLPQYPEASLATSLPPVDGNDGYVATKWASERFLERFHNETTHDTTTVGSPAGWPVTIHRPSSITSLADPSRVPGSDITHNALRFSRMLRKVPDFSKGKGFFDFVDIETIVGNIIGDVLGTEGVAVGSNSQVVYRHQSGDVVVPVGGLAGYLAGEDRKDCGPRLEYEVVDIAEWVRLAVKAGMDPLVGSFLAATEGKLDLPLLAKASKL
ncbi:hybrid polyketide synthase [Microdochium nivale]|nr:hybrid polyketide synthase [Microdochium nivale]